MITSRVYKNKYIMLQKNNIKNNPERILTHLIGYKRHQNTRKNNLTIFTSKAEIYIYTF